MAGLSAEETVRVAAHAALDKKAIDLAVLDLQGLSSVADFFLVCSARSAPQADTIAARCARRACGRATTRAARRVAGSCSITATW
jgi:ribosome-associated protein